MHTRTNRSLTIAALALFAGAALHVVALIAGPAMIGALGAPASIVESARHGTMLAPVSTLAIAAALAVLGAYALSGAGRLRPLPWTRFVLAAAACVFILRALALPAILALAPPARVQLSMIEPAASLVCLLIGLAFLSGLRAKAHASLA